MKHIAFILLFLNVFLASHAVADTSGNIGYSSEYIFRGIPQKTSSASAGIDWEQGSTSLGAWTGDVGDGLEVDLYGAYSGNFGTNDAFSYSIGGTYYAYTGDFDDDYIELNLGAGYGAWSVDIATGQYKNFAGPTLDYSYLALGLQSESGFYATLGSFFNDFDGEHLDIGYAMEIAESTELSAGFSFGNSDLLGSSDENFTINLTKTFSIN